MLLKTCFVCSLMLLVATSIDAGVLRQATVDEEAHTPQGKQPEVETTNATMTLEMTPKRALTKDEEATIELTVINDEFNGSIDSDSEAVDDGKLKAAKPSTVNEAQDAKLLRSAKLLLLSTPKLHERTQPVEENDKEEDVEAEGSGLIVTESNESENDEMTTTATIATTEDTMDETTNINTEVTKLFKIDDESPRPIAANAKKSEQLLLIPDDDDEANDGGSKSSYQRRREEEEAAEADKMKHQAEAEEFRKLNAAEAKAESKAETEAEADSKSVSEADSMPNPTLACNSTAAVIDQAPETPNDNIDAAIIIEADTHDDDFVVVEHTIVDVDDDVVHEHDELSDFNAEYIQGSFTHADSAEHLQPIVQSIEIVPPSLDETQIVNYVRSW